MNREVLKNIHSQVSHLQDIVGGMIFNGAHGSDMVDLLNRVVDVGHVTLMYPDSLSLEELSAVSKLLGLADEMAKTGKVQSIEANIQSVSRITDSISALYREKKLLLGHENDEKIKCA